MISFPLFASLIVGSVAAGYAGAWIGMGRSMKAAFGGGHHQEAFDLSAGAMFGVNKSSAVKILHDARLHHYRTSDFHVRECRPAGLWRLAGVFFGPGFSCYELQLRPKTRSLSEKRSRFMVSFCSPVTKENFLRSFAPELLEDDGRPKERREHIRETAALVRIARRRGHRRTKGKVKGFERTVEELACFFDPAAAGFSWMTGKKREISAVRKIYVRAIGALYQGYGTETIDTYLRAHFEEFRTFGKHWPAPE